MVEKIYNLKNKALQRMEQAIDERGVERMDVKEVGELADIVKDLAEAEKECWEAEYYMSVVEAMGDDQMGYGMGYARQGGSGGSQGGSGGSQGGMGYDGGRGYRRGYRGQPRDSQGQFTSRRGYRRMDGAYGHDDMMQGVRQMMETADPQEREQLRMQLRQMLDM